VGITRDMLSLAPVKGARLIADYITSADILLDLHEIFTHRLPDEVYFYLSRGLLSPHSL
jgi:hypothetical protein